MQHVALLEVEAGLLARDVGVLQRVVVEERSHAHLALARPALPERGDQLERDRTFRTLLEKERRRYVLNYKCFF